MIHIELDPVELNGHSVLLRPMELSDVDDLFAAGNHAEIWEFTIDYAGQTMQAMQKYVATAMGNRDSGIELPFVQIDQDSGKIIGSTRYQLTDPNGLEIGWTWIHPDLSSM